MTALEICYLPISEAGRRYRRGTLRPETLVQALLERIEQVDPAIRAWGQVWGDDALHATRAASSELQAGQDRGPLHGIPIGVKDLIDAAGYLTLADSPEVLPHTPALSDALHQEPVGDQPLTVQNEDSTDKSGPLAASRPVPPPGSAG